MAVLSIDKGFLSENKAFPRRPFIFFLWLSFLYCIAFVRQTPIMEDLNESEFRQRLQQQYEPAEGK